MALPKKKVPQESERSPAVFIANHKAGVLLKRDLGFLDKTERTVLHRVTMRQKITHRIFQKRKTQREIAHAKLMGDKAKERELRDTSQVRTLDTNLGEGEDDNLLKSIWRAGSQAIAIERERARQERESLMCYERPTQSIKFPSRPKTAGDSDSNISQNDRNSNKSLRLPRRPATAFEVSTRPKQIGRTRPKTSGMFIRTGGDDDDEEEEDSVDENYAESTLTSFSGADKVQTKQRSGPGPQTEPSQGLTSVAGLVVDPEARRQKLLSLNVARVQAANLPARINTFNRAISPYLLEQGRISRDYYLHKLLAECSRQDRGPREVPSDEQLSEKELLRYFGNPRVPNMTFKSLRRDFPIQNAWQEDITCI